MEYHSRSAVALMKSLSGSALVCPQGRSKERWQGCSWSARRPIFSLMIASSSTLHIQRDLQQGAQTRRSNPRSVRLVRS